MLSKILSNKYILAVACLVIGTAIGATFYPSKSITAEERSRYEKQIEKLQVEKRQQVAEAMSIINERVEENKEIRRESQKTIFQLRTENTQLKQKVKERIIKIVTPDGTIREEIVRESDTQIVSQIVTDIKQEFTEKVASIEQRWKTVHEKRVESIKSKYEKQLVEKEQTIAILSKKKIIEVNKRKFGISLGYTNDNQYFSSITYDIFGPMFLDIHLDSNLHAPKDGGNNEVGIGIGFKF